MNKNILKANELWRENDVCHALGFYQKALHCHSLGVQERAISLYMCAYLSCVIGRRSSQEEAFLGVDLRSPYQDYYFQAGQYLQQLEDSQFDPEELGLPVLDKLVLTQIEEAVHYQNQIKEALFQSWQVRLKIYIQHYMFGFVHRLQKQIRA